MIEQINTYFKAEKSESLLFLAAGIAAILFSIWAWLSFKQSFYTGIAIPLALVGLIQIVVGGTVYFKTDKQIATLEQQYETDKIAMAKSELPRMNTVMKNFTLYKYIEIAFILSGLICIFFLRQNDFWLGIGIGLLIQGTIMLVLDIFAEKRGEVYINWLHQLLS
jgi:hypothetical protein